MSTASHRPLHERVESLYDSGDLRLVYGVGVPLLLVVACVAGVALAGATWLVAPLMVVVLALCGIVVIGFNQMLEDDEGDEQR